MAVRLALLASVCTAPTLLSAAQAAPLGGHGRGHARSVANKAEAAPVPLGGMIQSIDVRGNTRIETSTVLSYLVVQPGDSFNRDALNR
ncbi:MAG: outer membrane protein assembly factor BamA, partial [Bombella apis]|nr:outer membrane protein assembly factor BamA [Bombella apis]